MGRIISMHQNLDREQTRQEKKKNRYIGNE